MLTFIFKIIFFFLSKFFNSFFFFYKSLQKGWRCLKCGLCAHWASFWSVRVRTRAFVCNHKAEWRSGNNRSKGVFSGAEESPLPLITSDRWTGWRTAAFGSAFISVPDRFPEEEDWVCYTTGSSVESGLDKMKKKFIKSLINRWISFSDPLKSESARVWWRPTFGGLLRGVGGSPVSSNDGIT